jgi:serine/threonine protein kinase
MERVRTFELVGKGGMAEVYRGELVGERGTGRRVAIKRLRPDRCHDPRAVELFVAEAKVAVGLDHANVIRGLELGRDEQGYFLVCDFFAGATLGQVHEHLGPLPPAVALSVANGVTEALAYLHGLVDETGAPRPIVHRDVTPANVFVAADGQVKLGDFGLAACHAASPVLASGGTPAFAAPEQTTGAAVDARADLFGLGATLRFACVDLPPSLADLVSRLTAPSPEDRPSDSAAVKSALTTCARDLKATLGAGTIRAWLDERGGLPKAPAAVSLDTQVRSLLGGSLAPPSVSTSVPATRRSRVAPTVSALAALLLVAVWWTTRPTGDAGPMAPTPAAVLPAAAPATTAPPPVNLPAQRPRQTGTGTVNFNSVPWAEVSVDGRAVGNTPLRALRLDEGSHLFEVTHPPQRLRRQFTVEVVAARLQTVVVDLHRGTLERRIEP